MQWLMHDFNANLLTSGNTDSVGPFALRKIVVDLYDNTPNSQYSILLFVSTAFVTAYHNCC